MDFKRPLQNTRFFQKKQAVKPITGPYKNISKPKKNIDVKQYIQQAKKFFIDLYNKIKTYYKKCSPLQQYSWIAVLVGIMLIIIALILW